MKKIGHRPILDDKVSFVHIENRRLHLLLIYASEPFTLFKDSIAFFALSFLFWVIATAINNSSLCKRGL